LVLASSLLEQDLGMPEAPKGAAQTGEIMVRRQVIAIDMDKSGPSLVDCRNNISSVLLQLPCS